MAQRENFFLLLDLDPEVDDWAAIEQRLREKRRAWSHDRSQGNPKARRHAERCLGLIPEIEAVLKQPESRRQEAREARKRQQEQRREQFQELDEAIGVLKSGGGACDEAQLRNLIQRFGRALSADEIKKRLAAAGVATGQAEPPRERRAREQIDKTTASTIRRNLQHLGLASLYEFLELRPQSSARALADRAEEIYRENQRLGRTDTDSSARNELAGLAKSLFRDEAEKLRYDNSLAVEAMEGLKENLELAGADRFIGRDEMDALLRQARKRGVSTEDARAYIEDYAARRKWGMQRDAELPAEELQLCGFCVELAPAGATLCPGCGEALVQPCPRCGTRNPTADAACARCGCRTGDAPLVHGLVREGERRLAEGDLAGARELFDKALVYWPGWERAEAGKERVRSDLQEREQAVAGIEKLVRERRLVAAWSALERFAGARGRSGLEGLERRIEEGTARAESDFRDGERLRRAGDLDAAIERYEEALGACADFEPARQALSASPPPPPTDLAVRSLASGFALRWQPAHSRRRVGYRVLRKAGGAPRDGDDGTVLGELQDARLDDPEARVGEAVCYAVFSSRAGIVSREAAHSGPHLRLAEVSGLTAVSGDREVSVHWTRPPGCREVTVWRKTGAVPTAPGDGEAVTAEGDGVHDAGLENGLRYGYRVVAHFADPEHAGRELSTAGETVSAVPAAPPAAVEDLRAVRTGRTVELTWTPITGARVELRQSSERPPCSPDQILATADLDRFGTPLRSGTGDRAHGTLGGQGRTFFTPFSIVASTAVAGRGVEVVSLDPVTGLTARRAGGGILLTWEWPDGLDRAVVCHSPDGYPENPRRAGGPRVEVTLRQYRRSGGWLLRNPEQTPHYFSVFSCGGEDLYAPPARALVGMGQTAAVAYRVVVQKKLLRRKVEGAWLELTWQGANGHPTALPELVVVGKARRVPLSPRDGEVLVETPAVRFDDGRARIPIPQSHWRDRSYLKLFFKDPAQAREVRLLPADKELLRLG